jgi:uncharacterized membrane protein
VDWNIPNGSGWWQFRYLILTLFIFTVGLSLSLAHHKKINKKTFYKRLWQLIASAAAITVMSLFLFPNAWIYFGILHFIAAASLLGIVFVKRPQISLALGGIILIGFWSDILKSDWPFALFEAWLPNHTEDFVPFFPWLGVMYLGLGIMGILIKNKLKQKIDVPDNWITQKIGLIGKHGLIIYLIHQPVFFSVFIAVDFFS